MDYFKQLSTKKIVLLLTTIGVLLIVNIYFISPSFLRGFVFGAGIIIFVRAIILLFKKNN